MYYLNKSFFWHKEQTLLERFETIQVKQKMVIDHAVKSESDRQAVIKSVRNDIVDLERRIKRLRRAIK